MSNLLVEAGLILGLPVILILLLFSRKPNDVNLFLTLSILSIWYSLLVTYLNSTREIFNYPFLIRTANITAYLILPFLYIFSRNTFYPGIFWRKTDWLFILPALIYVIDMLPFFFSASEYKIAITKLNLQNPVRMFRISEGWIPIKNFHFIFRYIWGIMVMFLQIRLIIRNWNFEGKVSNSGNRPLFWFIVSITTIYLPLLVPGIFGVLLKQKWYSLNFINIDLAGTLLVTTIFLLLSPRILYGFLPPVAKMNLLASIDKSKPENHLKKEIVEDLSSGGSTSPANKDQVNWAPIIENIMQFMEQNKPYLDPHYSIHNLGSDIQIPVYQLSPIINQHFDSNFNTWVNKYRICHFIDLCNCVQNRELTFDALAKESGFSNRTTFINAFKKEKGETPAVFIRNMVEGEKKE